MSGHLTPLRLVSPCEHGIPHHIREAPEGAAFAVPECRTKAGTPRTHHITPDKYPTIAHHR